MPCFELGKTTQVYVSLVAIVIKILECFCLNTVRLSACLYGASIVVTLQTRCLCTYVSVIAHNDMGVSHPGELDYYSGTLKSGHFVLSQCNRNVHVEHRYVWVDVFPPLGLTWGSHIQGSLIITVEP